MSVTLSQINYWVTQEVLRSHSVPIERARVIRKMIHVAYVCPRYFDPRISVPVACDCDCDELCSISSASRTCTPRWR